METNSSSATDETETETDTGTGSGMTSSRKFQRNRTSFVSEQVALLEKGIFIQPKEISCFVTLKDHLFISHTYYSYLRHGIQFRLAKCIEKEIIST